MSKKKQINYQSLYYMGITFVGTEVVFIASVNAVLGGAFISIGITNMIISWKNKDEWKK